MAQTKLIVTLAFCCLMASAKAQITENGQDIPAQQSFEADTIRVKVLSIPFGAEIRVAGKSIGITPCDILLPPGRHLVSLSLFVKGDQLYELKEIYLANDTTLFFYLEKNSIEKIKGIDTENFPTYEFYRYAGDSFTNGEKYRFSLVGFQQAWYTGELSNHIITHKYYILPIFAWDVWFKNVLLQISYLMGGAKANSININGDDFKGTFLSSSSCLNWKLGYEVFANKDFSVVPNIGGFLHSHTLETESTAKEDHYGNPVKEFRRLFYYSIGSFLDYQILKNLLTIRIYYDLGVNAQLDGNKTNGAAHHVTIGLVIGYIDY